MSRIHSVEWIYIISHQKDQPVNEIFPGKVNEQRKMLSPRIDSSSAKILLPTMSFSIYVVIFFHGSNLLTVQNKF